MDDSSPAQGQSSHRSPVEIREDHHTDAPSFPPIHAESGGTVDGTLY